MSGYAIGWLVVALSALALAGLLLVALKRLPRTRYLVAGLALVWSLLPFRFDGEHWAPAFAVAIFRLFLEDDANAAQPLALLGAGTAAALAVYFGAVGALALFGDRQRAGGRRRRGGGRPGRRRAVADVAAE